MIRSAVLHRVLRSDFISALAFSTLGLAVLFHPTHYADSAAYDFLEAVPAIDFACFLFVVSAAQGYSSLCNLFIGRKVTSAFGVFFWLGMAKGIYTGQNDAFLPWSFLPIAVANFMTFVLVRDRY